MKKVFVTLMIAMMGGLMTLPSVEAQSRPGRGGQHSTSNPGSRPGSSTRPSSGSPSTPSRPSTPSTSTPSRPGSSTPSQRPGQGGQNFRPGNQTKPTKPEQGNRPGNNNVRPSAPASPQRPTGPAVRPSAPAVRPSAPVTRPSVVAPPVRPGRPVYASPWTRPVPPASWRPVRRVSVVPNILGMTLGVTINSALDYLFNTGYSVDGYGSQEVYLRNVNELGYRWDDATLYFSNNGLVRSQFYDTSSGYSTSRYYQVFNTLSARYGQPVSVNNAGGQMTATWFGYQGDYITLQYTLLNTAGRQQYFTVLTYGN